MRYGGRPQRRPTRMSGANERMRSAEQQSQGKNSADATLSEKGSESSRRKMIAEHESRNSVGREIGMNENSKICGDVTGRGNSRTSIWSIGLLVRAGGPARSRMSLPQVRGGDNTTTTAVIVRNMTIGVPSRRGMFTWERLRHHVSPFPVFLWAPKLPSKVIRVYDYVYSCLFEGFQFF